MDEYTQPTAIPDTDSTEPTTNAADIEVMMHLLESAQRNLESIRQMLSGGVAPMGGPSIRTRAGGVSAPVVEDGMKIIEGVFDGQNMVGPDGKQYSVPANYASKSKLVEGDVLKLTITHDGSFIYKQIGPIERQRLIGVLTRDEGTNDFRVVSGGQSYKVLLASITYFKGEVGDEVVVLVPTGTEARWGAVENIIKKSTGEVIE